MQFLAVATLVGAAAAGMFHGTGGAVYTTETVTSLETYCPEPTTFSYEDHTYTVTEATTLTITDCPDHGCTVVKPVHTSTTVACGGHGCGGYGNGTVAYPTGTSTPTHPAPGCSGPSCPGGEGGAGGEGGDDTVSTSNAGKVAALSGAALAGVLAFAAAL